MPRVLVVAPNWIGDALMAQPLLARLRAQGRDIDVLAPEWVAPVVRRMPEVREVIPVPFRHGPLQLGARWRIGRSLAGRYDAAYVLPNTWKSALVPFFAGVPRRVGYVGEARFGLLNERLPNSRLPMRDHYSALAKGDAAPGGLTVDAAEIEAVKGKFGIAGPYAAYCPGAEYGPAKRWPHFAALAQRSALPVVLLGAKNDRAACAAVPGRNLAGETTLDEAIALLAGAAHVVSNDSGLMHVAAALGRPLVALFGSSSPEHTPPAAAPGAPAPRVLWLRVECSPCYQRVCPLGHFRCMKELAVERVLSEIQAL